MRCAQPGAPFFVEGRPMKARHGDLRHYVRVYAAALDAGFCSQLGAMYMHAALPPRSGDKDILSTYLEFTAKPTPSQR